MSDQSKTNPQCIVMGPRHMGLFLYLNPDCKMLSPGNPGHDLPGTGTGRAAREGAGHQGESALRESQM